MVQTRTLSPTGMGLATPENYLVREEPIKRLERIVFALSQSARQGVGPAAKTKAALGAALSARCARCGMSVTGEELLALSQLPANSEPVRVQRLRQGRCAREECQFDYCHLTFQNHPDLDWPRLLGSRETFAGEHSTPPAAEAEIDWPADTGQAVHVRRAIVRLAILAVVAMLVLMGRQIYYGGRIPVIREPEKFRVAPTPAGGEKNSHRQH